MAYHKDVREYLNALEAAGKLVRIKQPINKDTEMHPLVRLQYRGLPEADRRAFLFEKVVDIKGRSFEVPVAIACYAGNLDIYALGMQCRKDAIYDKWTRAQSNPIEPVEVASGPCHERVIQGDELRQTGLNMLPVPISTPGFDNGPYTTSSHFVTCDPETGRYNMGNYRGQIKATDRMGCYAGNFSGLRAHWNKCRNLKRPLAVACVIGVPPNLSYAAVARIAPELSEYGVAGGISGEPVELVRCKTVDLMVPAQAEIVIEGNIPTDESEWEGPFGCFPATWRTKGSVSSSTSVALRCGRIRSTLVFSASFRPAKAAKFAASRRRESRASACSRRESPT